MDGECCTKSSWGRVSEGKAESGLREGGAAEALVATLLELATEFGRCVDEFGLHDETDQNEAGKDKAGDEDDGVNKPSCLLRVRSNDYF